MIAVRCMRKACKAGSLHYKGILLFYSDWLLAHLGMSVDFFLAVSVAGKCSLTKLEMDYLAISQVI